MMQVDHVTVTFDKPVKERPILFQGAMVRALLAGTKTQTRRAWREQPPPGVNVVQSVNGKTACPYGQPGDRLWVRESFKAVTSGEVKNGYGELRHGWAYAADNAVIWKPRTCIVHDLTGQPATGPLQFRDLPWKPSIHMPRIASRILLEVTEVRVERLWAISRADVLAEGCDGYELTYAKLWESINGAGSWDENPWVWVVIFKRIKP